MERNQSCVPRSLNLITILKFILRYWGESLLSQIINRSSIDPERVDYFMENDQISKRAIDHMNIDRLYIITHGKRNME